MQACIARARVCTPSNASATYEIVLRVGSRKSSTDLHTRQANKTIEYACKEISMCVLHVWTTCSLARAHTAQGASCVCVCPVFRPALIVVTGRMPRESPSSSRGPPPPTSPFAAISRAFPGKSHPHPCVKDDGGAHSGTRAVSNRATPKCVAPLPARRARQMFFVADYDAVCAIMTTSLFLSLTSLLSPTLTVFPSTPQTPALSARWLDFFSPSLSLFLSPSVSSLLSFSYLVAEEDKLCSCLSRQLRRRLGHAKRRLSSFFSSL